MTDHHVSRLEIGDGQIFHQIASGWGALECWQAVEGLATLWMGTQDLEKGSKKVRWQLGMCEVEEFDGIRCSSVGLWSSWKTRVVLNQPQFSAKTASNWKDSDWSQLQQNVVLYDWNSPTLMVNWQNTLSNSQAPPGPHPMPYVCAFVVYSRWGRCSMKHYTLNWKLVLLFVLWLCWKYCKTVPVSNCLEPLHVVKRLGLDLK